MRSLFLAVILAAIAFSIAGVRAEPAKEPRTSSFGDLQLTYDPALWTVSESDGRLAIECTDRACRNISVYASIVDDPDDDRCNDDALRARLANETEVIEYLPDDASLWRARPGGLVFHFAELYFGCRNLAGGPVAACTHYRDKTYFFDAPGEHCHTPWGIGAAVEELLAGVTPR